MLARRPLTPLLAAAALALGAVVAALPASGTTTQGSGTAPGRPGKPAPYLQADKSGFGTAHGTRSKLWFTLERGGGTGELYYPDLTTPAVRTLGFAVTDDAGHLYRVADAAHAFAQTRSDSLSYRQTDTEPGHWRLVSTYVTDPDTAALRVRLDFTALDDGHYSVFALLEPTLSNTPKDDSGHTVGTTLVAHDASAASAFTAQPAFTATSNGYRGTSDGWTDLADGRLDHHYPKAPGGYLVQTGQTSLTGRPGARQAVLTLGFGANVARAQQAVAAADRRPFDRTAYLYAYGWSSYLHSLAPAPASLTTSTERRLYASSELVLAASEDKTHRGAYVASPTMPWAWGSQHPSGPYHLVWSRDLYEIATALIADGDVAGANRALSFLFDTQQKADGSFPQNSTTDGTPFWTGLQLDEVADPIVLAYQLHRTDASTWTHVKAAADFLLGFSQDGYAAPYTPQERWENQSGYSPASIASEIAGLVCAATIARANGDSASARRYLSTADDWRAHLKGWTVTSDGPYSSQPYFLRLTKDGHPNRGTTYAIGDGGPGAADQRSVVDPSFLELVRLGVLKADDPTVQNSLRVVDRQLSYRTDHGTFWHRASFDGYGETFTGAPWTLGNPDNSFLTHGRGWPLLNGERGEYDLAAGNPAGAAKQLATMTSARNVGYLLPEQVWDNESPGGQPGFEPGTPTLSATPLAWTHAQYIRLAQDLAAGKVTEQPAAVAHRYGT